MNQFKLAAASVAIAALAGAGAAQASGFDLAWGSARSVLASVDQSGNTTNESDFGVTLGGFPGARNASGAFLFDNLSLGAGGSGTQAIDWLNGGGGTANYSSLTLSTRDDVVVTPVPEPQTYALMLAGLSAVGFIARRRKPV